MEMETVSVASMIGMGVSMLLSMGIPVGLLIYGKVKKDAKFSSFFIGAGTFFVFAMVLEQILHMVVLGGVPDIQNNIWMYGLYGAAAAAVFEETGRFVAMKFLMKKIWILKIVLCMVWDMVELRPFLSVACQASATL